MKGETSEEVEQETKAAIRLLFAIIGVAFCMWFALGYTVDEAETLRSYGRAEASTDLVAVGARRLYDAQHRARTLDRKQKWGDRPLVYLLGSSITRESFDERRLRFLLFNHGVEMGTEKFGFDRGGPIFSWATAQEIELSEGDLVVTTVQYDNFRNDWLNYHGGFSAYLNYLMTPAMLAEIDELHWQDKLDYSLASIPPRRGLKWMPEFRYGVEGWLQYSVMRGKKPSIFEGRGYSVRDQIRNFREMKRFKKNDISFDEINLSEKQTNYLGLKRLKELVESQGATLWVVFVPAGPEYAPRFLREDFDESVFHEHFRREFAPYFHYPELPQNHYQDFKHPNNEGRAVFTELLAAMIWRHQAGSEDDVPVVVPFSVEEVAQRQAGLLGGHGGPPGPRLLFTDEEQRDEWLSGWDE